jgi:DNA-binding CsgD family transcriptional regulator
MNTDCPERPVVGGRRRDDASVLLHAAAPAPVPTIPLHAGAMPAPLTDLLAADDAQARHRIVAGLLQEVDHDWLVYGRLELAGDRLRPVALWTAHADTEWARRYCAQAYHEVDPRLEAAAASSLPRTWTLDGLHQRAQGAAPRSALRRFIADLGDTGMRSGALFMLPGEGARRRDFMSLLARAPGPRRLEGALLGRVLTLGLCLHEYYTRYSALPAVPEPVAALTPVQREILGHVARGESDKRIAHHLRISAHAVDYHMRQLRHRFAVHNRVQLAQASRGIVG